MFWRVLLLLLFTTSRNLKAFHYDSEEEDDSISTTTSEPLPFFDDHTGLLNVTVPLGSTAFLHCKVNLLKDKTVSWMKGSPNGLKLLTFGFHTFSEIGKRISINFEQPNNWKLRISQVEKGDGGPYQCQVSTHPPIKIEIKLTIIVPQIKIVDDLDRPIPDKFYNAGSTLELRCVVTHYLPVLYTILWKQGNKTLNYDAAQRGGISVKTTIKKEGAVSVLYIANAKKNDSGQYICALGNLTQNSIDVHVINGESLGAAMQHSRADIKNTLSNALILLPVLSIFIKYISKINYIIFSLV